MYAIETRKTIESSAGSGVGGAGASAVIKSASLSGSTATQALDGTQLWGRHQLPPFQAGTLERPAEAEHSGSPDRCVPERPDSLPPPPLTTGSAAFWVDDAEETMLFGSSAVVWEPISAPLDSPGWQSSEMTRIRFSI